MLDKKKMASVTESIDSEYWRECYEAAPSSACKHYIALLFYYSDYGSEESFDMEAFQKEKERLESLFGLSDWKHMLKYCGNNPLVSKYRAMIAQWGRR